MAPIARATLASKLPHPQLLMSVFDSIILYIQKIIIILLFISSYNFHTSATIATLLKRFNCTNSQHPRLLSRYLFGFYMSVLGLGLCFRCLLYCYFGILPKLYMLVKLAAGVYLT